MSVDLDVDAACGASSVGFDFFEEKEESQSPHFHGSIFVPPYYPSQFCNHSTLNFQNRESLKTILAVNERLNYAITKGNKAGGSAKKDSEGNESAEVYISHEEKDERGNNTSSFGVSGGARKDKDGNTSYEIEGSFEVNFNHNDK